VSTKTKAKKRSERVVEPPPEETAAEAKARASVPPPPPRTRLACVRMKLEVWSALNATAPRALRRIPAGAVFTDPTGNGIKAEVETAGVPLLLRNRRGRWKRYDVAGALWPKGVQEQLAEHVVGTEGWTAPAPVGAPPRWAVEEGTLRYVGARPKGREWHQRTVWSSLHEARVEAERAAVADARLNRDIHWRIVDRGTGAKRGLWQRRKVLKEMRLTRLDLSPGLKTDRPTPVVVDVSKGGPS